MNLLSTFDNPESVLWGIDYLGDDRMALSLVSFEDDSDDGGDENDELGAIKIYDLKTKQVISTLNCEANRMHAMKNNRLLTNANQAKEVRLWDLNTNRCQTFNSQGFPCAMTQLNNGNIVIGVRETTSDKFALEFFKIDNLAQAAFVQSAHEREINALQPLPDDMVASAADDNLIKIWSKDFQLKHTLHGHAKDVNCVEFYKDNIIFSGSNDGTIRVWDFGNGKELKIIAGLGIVSKMRLLPNGIVMTVESFGMTDWLRFYRLPSFDKVGEIKANEMSETNVIHDVQVVKDEYILCAVGRMVKLFNFKTRCPERARNQ